MGRWVLTVVPVSGVDLGAFGFGDDIGEFVCGTLRSLFYDRRVLAALPFDYAACRVALGADVRGGVLAPGQYSVCW